MSDIVKIRKEVFEFLNPLGFDAKVTKDSDGIRIEPNTQKVGKRRKDFFDGLVIMKWDNGVYEVAEHNAGKNNDELWVYKETKSLNIALKCLLQGNKQKPIKRWK